MDLLSVFRIVGILAGMAGAVISFIMVVAAVASAIFAGTVWLTARKAMLHQALLDVQRNYRSGEMQYAIRTLWDFYKKEGKKNFVEKYEAIRREDEQRISALPPEDRLRAEQATLHYQRRLVSHFYQHLASLHINGVLSRKILYTGWSERDLRIIPEVIVPIESRLPRELSGSPPLDENSPLIILYRDSKKS